VLNGELINCQKPHVNRKCRHNFSKGQTHRTTPNNFLHAFRPVDVQYALRRPYTKTYLPRI
jgi:hypothetical protein